MESGPQEVVLNYAHTFFDIPPLRRQSLIFHPGVQALLSDSLILIEYVGSHIFLQLDHF